MTAPLGGYNIFTAHRSEAVADGVSYLWIGRRDTLAEAEEVIARPQLIASVHYRRGHWVVARDADDEQRVAAASEILSGGKKPRVAVLAEADLASGVLAASAFSGCVDWIHTGLREHVRERQDDWWRTMKHGEAAFAIAMRIGAMTSERALEFARAEVTQLDARGHEVLRRFLQELGTDPTPSAPRLAEIQACCDTELEMINVSPANKIDKPGGGVAWNMSQLQLKQSSALRAVKVLAGLMRYPRPWIGRTPWACIGRGQETNELQEAVREAMASAHMKTDAMDWNAFRREVVQEELATAERLRKVVRPVEVLWAVARLAG